MAKFRKKVLNNIFIFSQYLIIGFFILQSLNCYPLERDVADAFPTFDIWNSSDTTEENTLQEESTTVNICEGAGNCSHGCSPSDNMYGYSCTCPDGMALDESGLQCEGNWKDADIVLGHGNTLSFYAFGHNGTELIQKIVLKNFTEIGAVEFNSINHTIFISDIVPSGVSRIYEFSPGNKTLRVVVDSFVYSVVGMSLDVVGQNLYWVDNAMNAVVVMSLRTGAIRQITVDFDAPQAIVVVPEKGLFFVALTSPSDTRILKYNMDGSGRYTIKKIEDARVVSLDYNRKLNRLFWTDVVKNTINSTVLDGGDTSVLRSDESEQPEAYSSLVTVNDTLYWVDRKTHQIHSMSLINSTFVKSPEYSQGIVELDNYPKICSLRKDLSLYQKLISRHNCSVKNGKPKCSHLCLMSSNLYLGKCLCPDDLDLDINQTTCSRHCTVGNYQCNNGTCISGDWKCDGHRDCLTGEDETECPTAPSDPAGRQITTIENKDCNLDEGGCQVNVTTFETSHEENITALVAELDIRGDDVDVSPKPEISTTVGLRNPRHTVDEPTMSYETCPLVNPFDSGVHIKHPKHSSEDENDKNIQGDQSISSASTVITNDAFNTRIEIGSPPFFEKHKSELSSSPIVNLFFFLNQPRPVTNEKST